MLLLSLGHIIRNTFLRNSAYWNSVPWNTVLMKPWLNRRIKMVGKIGTWTTIDKNHDSNILKYKLGTSYIYIYMTKIIWGLGNITGNQYITNISWLHGNQLLSPIRLKFCTKSKWFLNLFLNTGVVRRWYGISCSWR